MSDYDDMTNTDVLSGEEMCEYDQVDEALFDTQEEKRWAGQDDAGPTDEP
ncbi:hypothetical protein [Streptomyces sp. CFMR 7]|nr:hypothetical protein [Streptomyces sp. CFMR 7]